MANHPELISAAKTALDDFGYGMASVRFICGTHELHKTLEHRLARYLEKDDLKGVYGREIFETWYKMIAMLQNGLDVSKVITHRYKACDFESGFADMLGGSSGKVVLDWTSLRGAL